MSVHVEHNPMQLPSAAVSCPSKLFSSVLKRLLLQLSPDVLSVYRYVHVNDTVYLQKFKYIRMSDMHINNILVVMSDMHIIIILVRLVIIIHQ